MRNVAQFSRSANYTYVIYGNIYFPSILIDIPYCTLELLYIDRTYSFFALSHLIETEMVPSNGTFQRKQLRS